MIKLILCLVSSIVIAACVLQLRQQRINMNYESNRLHDQLEAGQARLWNQQLQIAVCTAPNAITETVGHHDLKMASPALGQTVTQNWVLSSRAVSPTRPTGQPVTSGRGPRRLANR